MSQSAIRISTGILLLIIALNALGGGWYGMAGAENVPPEWLHGSPFHSYFIPSLFLFIGIGLLFLYTSILVFKKSLQSRKLTLLCSFILSVWIIIQMGIIGYVSWLQPAMLLAALVMFILSRQIFPGKESR